MDDITVRCSVCFREIGAIFLSPNLVGPEPHKAKGNLYCPGSGMPVHFVNEAEYEQDEDLCVRFYRGECRKCGFKVSTSLTESEIESFKIELNNDSEKDLEEAIYIFTSAFLQRVHDNSAKGCATQITMKMVGA